MPAKRKATEITETAIIAPVDTKTAKITKAKVQVIKVDNDEDTRIVTTPVSTKAVKGKASKATKAAPTSTKAQPQTAKAKKAPKEKLPKPVTITRFELAQEMAKVVGEHMEITGQEADAIVSEIIHTMIDSLKTGDEIEIRGFGSFRVRQRNARTGRNPKTGAKVDVVSKRVVYFKMGKDLKETLIAHREPNNIATPSPVTTLPTVKPAKSAKQTKAKSS